MAQHQAPRAARRKAPPTRYVYPGAPGLVAIGLVAVVGGGWLWLHLGDAAAACSGGLILLTRGQVLAGFGVLTGAALSITGLALSLKQRA